MVHISARRHRMRLVGKIIVIVLAVIGGLFVAAMAAGVVAGLSARPQPLPAHIVLSLNLDDGVAEARLGNPLARLAGHSPLVLSELVQTLDRASRDSRVSALVVRLGAVALDMATAQELRGAVQAFHRSGKRAVAFSEDLGGFGGSTVSVYLASAFPEVWLQPSGDVGLSGFMLQSPFVKGTLALLGVDPEFAGRWEYKSAIETFTHDKFSTENRESLEMLVTAWTDQVAEGIAAVRGLKADDVRTLMDKGPLLAEEARDAKLVDRLGYWDELRATLVKDGAVITDIESYADRLGPQPEAVKVALIVGAGPVVSGDDEDSFGGGLTMAADRITQAFRDAVADPEIKAILFRIDSPGGSYTASDAIWREVGNARAAGKPVVVSMGNVAASGGYFAAMAADWIVAQPGTITGSIGVFSGKFVLADMWKKLGITWDEVHRGENAGMFSANQPFSPQGWARLNAMLDHVYADFTGKAAKARKLDETSIDAVARGRIWPGGRAREVGLVDETGGYPEAFAAIRRLARLPSQLPVHLVSFPRQRTPFEEFMKIAERGELPGDVGASLALEARIAAVLRPFAGMVSGGDGTLLMPPLETH
jgi:protease-4